MADSGYKRSFRRLDGDRPQQQRDERDWRDRGGRGRDRDQDRDRDWDRARDRGNRNRDRDRDRDRDWDADRNRRYRSRSRDRRDRRRSRSRSPGRDDNRARRQRPEEPAALAEVPRRALYYEESSPQRSASPARDADFPPTHAGDDTQADAHDNGHGTTNTGLPTRPRVTDKQHTPTAGPIAPMSFRVGGDHSGHYGEEGRGRSRQREDNSTAMDEDGEYAGGGRAHSEEGEVEDDDEVVVEDDGTMDAMQAMMGFSGFSSTKGKKVAGNNVGAVHKAKKTEYRQYMNRVGGFNRPLSPSR